VNDPVALPDAPDAADEVGSIARELARGYLELVESFRRTMGLSAEEADKRARDPGLAAWQHRYLTDPPDQVSWWGLSSLVERDPEQGRAAWERVKTEALKELASGHRAAMAMEAMGGRPWDRARFLAIREGLRAAWQPRGGVECLLVEALAISFAEYLRWTARLTMEAEMEGQLEDHKLKQDGYWQPPRSGVAAAMNEAAAMADRAHRRFLLTLRAMQALRRAPAVQVVGAAQVSVGGQQLNLVVPSAGANDPESGAHVTEVTQHDGLGAAPARRAVLHAQPEGRRKGRAGIRRRRDSRRDRREDGRAIPGRPARDAAGVAGGAIVLGAAGRADRDARRPGGGGGTTGSDCGRLSQAPPRPMEETAG
jgi:hypothetical protein